MEQDTTVSRAAAMSAAHEVQYSGSAVVAVTAEKTSLRTAIAVLRTVRRTTMYCLPEIGIQWRYNYNMTEELLEITEQDDHDFQNPLPQMDDEETRWLILKYGRFNGCAGIALYRIEEVSMKKYRKWRDSEDHEVEELTDSDLMNKLDENAFLEDLHTQYFTKPVR